MKYARPLVVIAQGDAKEILSKAKGSFFANEDPKDIARAFDEAMSLKEKDHFGLNNKSYFEENFTLSKLTHLLVEELIVDKK